MGDGSSILNSGKKGSNIGDVTVFKPEYTIFISGEKGVKITQT